MPKGLGARCATSKDPWKAPRDYTRGGAGARGLPRFATEDTDQTAAARSRPAVRGRKRPSRRGRRTR